MKRYTSLILFISIMVMQPALSHAVDYSGQWLGTITESKNLCENLGKAEPGDYKLTITQKDNDIIVMENVIQRPYSGVINPERPYLVQVQGVYIDDGGYVTEIVNIAFESDIAGKGQSVWRWSDGYYACGGIFDFSLAKIRP